MRKPGSARVCTELELLEEEWTFARLLARRVSGKLRGNIFAGITDRSARIARARELIVKKGLAACRASALSPETFADYFTRLYEQPLVVADSPQLELAANEAAL